ncbi:hypothetical protein AB0L85_26610 [Streptomyces sp. NPDC052051]|uniref:hypothetical protein n=1 Tax=Streptomyces sp. NPDC052051 TaxID=3154649 RepID=UPI003424F998
MITTLVAAHVSKSRGEGISTRALQNDRFDLPEAVSPVEAATLPLPGLTPPRTRDRLAVSADQRPLIAVSF